MMRIANVVLNDYIRDNRVERISRSLSDYGHEVLVVALKSEDTAKSEEKNGVRIERMGIRTANLPRGTFWGMIKFIELAWIIARSYRHFDIWHCNDVEAFAIGILAKVLRPKLKLVYDCHEYEAERNGKPRIELQMVALFEKLFIRQAAAVITVSPSIAKAYRDRFRVEKVFLVRNVPHRKKKGLPADRFRQHFEIPANERIFLYQGTFTYNRGLEEALEAFKEMEGVHLVCMGYGLLQAQVEEAANACDNIHFMPAVPYHEVLSYTSSADVGLLSVKPTCLSYLYCLPNKLFEYIQAGIPVLANNLPDCRAILEEYNIGRVIEEYNVASLKRAVEQMHDEDLAVYQEGLQVAAEDLHWEREEGRLMEVYHEVEP